MSFSRALLCIFLPPVAVLDRGCGPTLVVGILTLLGWIPGAIAALLLSGQPRINDTADVYNLPRLPQSQWDALLKRLPPAGPFEPVATEMQLDHLWRMGCVETDKIRDIRKLQASWLIDAGMRLSSKRGLWIGFVVLAAMVIVGSIGAAGWYFHPVLLQMLEARPAPTPTPAPLRTAPTRPPPGGEAFGRAATPTPTPMSTPTPAPTPVFTPTPEPDQEGDRTPAAAPPPVTTLRPLEPGEQVRLRKPTELSDGRGGSVTFPAGSQVTVIESMTEGWVEIADRNDLFKTIVKRVDLED